MDRVKIGSLPAELTSFVGRRRQVRDVKRLLSGGRLVTLTGVGGSGKTRLALRVAAELRRAFPDGVWFVDLSQPHGSDRVTMPPQDPDVLAYLVGASLGLSALSVGPPLRLLADQLASWHTLLVLDNCEHLLPACAILADTLLRACPNIWILATSREPLSTAGEVICAVPPLSIPDPQRHEGLTELSRYESVALFAARADAVQPGFQLTEHNHFAVAALCRRLEGLPLAIELAAARIRVLAPQDMLDRLTNRFSLLSRGPRNAPQRQQTLRDCVDWSFELCAKPEQRLWARLSVFSGGFQLDAVDGICADETLPAADLLNLVAGLVDKSILVRGDQGKHARYWMLETIREYGQEKLRMCGEAAIFRRRHADWHLHRAQQAEQEWFGPDQGGWCRWLRVEHANLRGAFDYYLATPDCRRRGLRLAGTLWFYWLVFGLVLEGRDWLRRALEVNIEPTRDRATALWVDGHLASVQGDLDAATSRLERAHDLARELGDALTQARAIKRLGAVAMHRGDFERADTLLVEALARLEAVDESGASTVHARIALAMNNYVRGDLAAAAEQGQQVLAVCRPRGDQYVLAHALNNLARVELARGQLTSAAAYAQEALQLRRTLPDALTLMFSLDLLAEIAAASGDHERAATLIGAARRRWQTFGRSVRRWEILAAPHQAWETQTRRALGEAAFAAAIRRGAEFIIDDLIPFALGQEVKTAPDADTNRPGGSLTPREAQIAELVAQGMSNKQIAAKLVISQRTAESHVEHILHKLGLTSRTQVVSWFRDR